MEYWPRAGRRVQESEKIVASFRRLRSGWVGAGERDEGCSREREDDTGRHREPHVSHSFTSLWFRVKNNQGANSPHAHATLSGLVGSLWTPRDHPALFAYRDETQGGEEGRFCGRGSAPDGGHRLDPRRRESGVETPEPSEEDRHDEGRRHEEKGEIRREGEEGLRDSRRSRSEEDPRRAPGRSEQRVTRPESVNAS